MRLEPLRRDHDRSGFTCGEPVLDEWFRSTARQAQDADSSSTYVLTEDGRSVLGFFSMSVHTVAVEESPEALVRGFPKHLPVPALLLGRLAVAEQVQRQRLGERLLRSALNLAVDVQQSVGVRLLVVDALNGGAAEFYEKYGFVPWPADSLRLFVRIRDIAESLAD